MCVCARSPVELVRTILFRGRLRAADAEGTPPTLVAPRTVASSLKASGGAYLRARVVLSSRQRAHTAAAVATTLVEETRK